MRMEEHARTWCTPKQKAELWERWKSGQCVADIARALERRNKSGVAEIKRRAESVAALVSRGLDYYNKNDPDRAIAEYTEAIRLDPKYVDAFHNRGNAYRAASY